MRFLLPVAISLLMSGNLGPTVGVPGILPGAQCVAQGIIKIINPKVKQRGGLADASGVVVWLVPAGGIPRPDDLHIPKRQLLQQDKRFTPHVMAIQVGTEVDFPNRDPFFHNVFSVFDGKPFDLGLYGSGESRPVRFSRPGVSFVYCNIHPQMSAVIVTLDSPYFAVTGPDGRYAIENLPQGAYTLHLWHERSNERQLEAQSRTISIDSTVNHLGVIQLDEAGYIARAHKNKNGEEYSSDPGLPGYARN